MGNALEAIQNAKGPDLSRASVKSFPSLENITDEVFSHENVTTTPGRKASAADKKTKMRKMQSDPADARVAKDLLRPSNEWIRSETGRSASCDSTIDGLHKDGKRNSRVAELEQELICAKCELAEALNKETCYKEILHRRDSVILQLDERLEQLEDLTMDKKSQDKRLKERVRMLQNQNRFLTEEIKKLAVMKQQATGGTCTHHQKLESLEAEIESWKRDYVYLVQSSITVPTGDVMDGMEVRLYGGNRHRDRIKKLLEEARITNPSLPTFDKLVRADIHIDQYGFQHTHQSEGLVLHYICQQLNQFYVTQLASYETHQQRWGQVLARGNIGLIKMKELKWLVRGGIPPQFRSTVWCHLVNQKISDIKDERGVTYYSYLCNVAHDSEDAGRYRKQISLDLLRTMPTNVNFSTADSHGIQRLQEVLVAHCIHNPAIGYCQGMNFIVGMFLLFMDAEDAFWALVAITERYFAPHYFDKTLTGAQADQEVLKELLRDCLPLLHQHLIDMDIDISTITLNWFLAIFFDAVPFETLIRLWDCFLLEGPKVLFRFSLAILKLNESNLLHKRDTIGIMRHLKSCTKIMFDAEGIIKTAFEDLKPFPHRKDITSRQHVYHNTLKEKIRKRDMLRQAYVDREDMLRDLEPHTGNRSMIECAAAYQEGVLWLCHGEQHAGHVCIIDILGGLMLDMGITVDSRIMCVACINENVLLVGTLSRRVYAFNTRNRRELWTVLVHDTILSMCCHLLDTTNKVFLALADGTVAVLENVNDNEPREDPLYIPIGRHPVTTLLLWEGYLWTGCGNCVHILNADTLDTVDMMMVSSNVFDHVLCIVPSDLGMWIGLKGSSIVQLWDCASLSCKMLYDVKENKYPDLKKVLWSQDDHESKLNTARITALLPCGNLLWVGTGDGTLIIYEILPRGRAANPKLASPTVWESFGSDGMFHPEGLSTRSHDEVKDRGHKSSSMAKGKQRSRSSSKTRSTKKQIAKQSFSRSSRSSKSSHRESVHKDTSESGHKNRRSSKHSVHTNTSRTHETASYADESEITTRENRRESASRENDAAGQSSKQAKEKAVVKLDSSPRIVVRSRKHSGGSKSSRSVHAHDVSVSTGKELSDARSDVQQSPHYSGYEEIVTKHSDNRRKRDSVSQSVPDHAIINGKEHDTIILVNYDRHSRTDKKEKGDNSSGVYDIYVYDQSAKDSVTDNASESRYRTTGRERTRRSSSKSRSHERGTSLESHQRVGYRRLSREASLETVDRGSTKDYGKSHNRSKSLTTNDRERIIIVSPKGKELSTLDLEGYLLRKSRKSDSAIMAINARDLKLKMYSRSNSLQGYDKDRLVAGKYSYRDYGKREIESSLRNSGSSLKEDSKDKVRKYSRTDSVSKQETEMTRDGQYSKQSLHTAEKQSQKLERTDKAAASKDRTSATLTNVSENSPRKLSAGSAHSSTKSSDRGAGRTSYSGTSDKESRTDHKTQSRHSSRKEVQSTSLVKARSEEAGRARRQSLHRSNTDVTAYTHDRGSVHHEMNGELESDLFAAYTGLSSMPSKSRAAILQQMHNKHSTLQAETTSETEEDGTSAARNALKSSVASLTDRPESLNVKRRSRDESKALEAQTVVGADAVKIHVDSASDYVGGSDSSINKRTYKAHRLRVDREDSLSHGWSSVDEASSSNYNHKGQDEKTIVKPGSSARGRHSRNASTASLISLSEEQQYSFQLSLQAKVKISDKAIRCLLKTCCMGETVIISCAGCYGDDEAVLKWKREANEMLWTNEPMYEVCPVTHMPKAPKYMQQIVARKQSADIRK